jgi:hypothetical protein
MPRFYCFTCKEEIAAADIDRCLMPPRQLYHVLWDVKANGKPVVCEGDLRDDTNELARAALAACPR